MLLASICLLVWNTAIQPVFSQSDDTGEGIGHCSEQVATYENWNPVADYPIEQLEELLSTLVAQQDLNVTIANIAILYDLKLYVLADKLEEALPAEERSTFHDEQRAWVSSRRESLEQNHTRVNGTLAPFVTATSFVNLTKDRIALLEAQLQSLKTE
ncbi:MAG: lysozyme inhibitor LprI family protein [Synechococcus sp.]